MLGSTGRELGVAGRGKVRRGLGGCWASCSRTRRSAAGRGEVVEEDGNDPDAPGWRDILRGGISIRMGVGVFLRYLVRKGKNR